jgi:hypothetical protein
MGCSAGWLDDTHQIFQFTFEHPWTWEQYYAVLDWALPEIAAAGHPVATILDVNKMLNFPPGNIIAQLDGIGKRMPPNIYFSVIVSPPRIAKLFMDILTRVQPNYERFNHFTETMDQAQSLITKRHAEQFPPANITD